MTRDVTAMGGAVGKAIQYVTMTAVTELTIDDHVVEQQSLNGSNAAEQELRNASLHLE
jgi:hypothetical protein